MINNSNNPCFSHINKPFESEDNDLVCSNALALEIESHLQELLCPDYWIHLHKFLHPKPFVSACKSPKYSNSARGDVFKPISPMRYNDINTPVFSPIIDPNYSPTSPQYSSSYLQKHYSPTSPIYCGATSPTNYN
eukprot:150874_1